MGDRSRKDTPGHFRRGKGKPTPQAPQNQPAAASVPPTVIATFAVGFQAAIGEHPAVQDPLLDLSFLMPGGAGTVTVRVALDVWPTIREQIDQLVERAGPDVESRARAAKIGLHLADGKADLAAEAGAHDQIKKGPA